MVVFVLQAPRNEKRTTVQVIIMDIRQVSVSQMVARGGNPGAMRLKIYIFYKFIKLIL